MENQQLEQQPTQRVGAGFSLTAMQQAQLIALDCLQQIAARLQPGISEADAIAIANTVLQQAGAEQHWHPPIIRFGYNTAKIYNTDQNCLQ